MVGYCGVKKRKHGVIDVYDYYICTDMACGNRYFPTTATDHAVVQALVREIRSIRLVEQAYSDHNNEVAQTETGIERHRKELAHLWKQKTKVVNVFKEDLITNAEATVQLRDINKKLMK